ncbi:MAG: SOS response-associated peptidase [Actinomycetota bacterium]|nr:SOS response-associated peptidase [Actinomycetota bacterium]
MCGRFALHEPVEDLVARFSVDQVGPGVDREGPRWNVAPTQPVLVVSSGRDGQERRLWAPRWGLVPSWAPDPSVGNRMINARAETLGTSRAFRRAFASRRCLIPASGFYEWRKAGGADRTGPAGHAGSGGRTAPLQTGSRETRSGATRSRSGTRGGARQPFYVHSADGSPLALAGLWEVWHDAEEKPLYSCTIVTTAASSDLDQVHDRMPLVLPPEMWNRWLGPGPLNETEAAQLLAPPAPCLLVLQEVGSRVNSPANDGPDLIEPVGETSAGAVPPVLPF